MPHPKNMRKLIRSDHPQVSKITNQQSKEPTANWPTFGACRMDSWIPCQPDLLLSFEDAELSTWASAAAHQKDWWLPHLLVGLEVGLEVGWLNLGTQ